MCQYNLQNEKYLEYDIREHDNTMKKEQRKRQEQHRREQQIEIDLPCEPLHRYHYDQKIDQQFKKEF